MKTAVGALTLVFWLAVMGHAQEAKFFPRSGIGGYAQFDFAAPHNEWDLNRCAVNAGASWNGGAGAPCTAFARAVLGGQFEFKPVNLGPFKRLFVSVSPRLFLGENLPQARYTMSFDGIGVEREFGLVYLLPRGFELLGTQHAKIYWLGKYQKPLGAADLHNSPYGQFNSVGVRWKFGTYRNIRSEK